jgi:phosphoribosylanthranilate isomerase
MKGWYKAKICGTTNLEDVRLSADEGADYFGVVVEVDFSPRSLTVEDAGPLFAEPPIPGVALVFKMKEARIQTVIQELNPFAVQFLDPAEISLLNRLKSAYPSVEMWQSVHLPQAGQEADIGHVKKIVQDYVDAGVDSLLFDTVAVSEGKTKFGGTGKTSDWDLVKGLIDTIQSPVPVWLAGGINPENVGDALDSVDPYGIDLCSGVEARPGKKDRQKIKALMSTIRERSTLKGQSK